MDLTKKFLLAKDYLNEIPIEQVISMTYKFSEGLEIFIDWDQEDGEQWGRLLQGKRLVGLFNATLPLFFVDNSIYNSFIQFFKSSNMDRIVVQKVETWEDANYSIDFSAVSEIVHWNSVSTPKDEFSIKDLWFATI